MYLCIVYEFWQQGHLNLKIEKVKLSIIKDFIAFSLKLLLSIVVIYLSFENWRGLW